MFAEQMLPRARERLATIGAGAPVIQAADLMSKPHIDLLVVCNLAGGMVGVVTKTDIVGQIRQCSGGDCTAGVDTIMTRSVISCRPSDLLHDVWSVMKERGLQRIPIVDQGGKPIGIVYARDALQHLLGETENDEALLLDYVIGNRLPMNGDVMPIPAGYMVSHRTSRHDLAGCRGEDAVDADPNALCKDATACLAKAPVPTVTQRSVSKHWRDGTMKEVPGHAVPRWMGHRAKIGSGSENGRR